MKVTMQVDDATAWSALFGSGWERHGWWRHVEFEEGADWTTPGAAAVTALNPDRDDEEALVEVRVTVERIEAALAAAEHRTYWGTFLWDFESYDASVGDALMQLVVFGREVYA